MNDLLSLKRIASFERLLAAYARVNGGNPFDAIDGGAGSGATARQMLEHLGPTRRVYAFEPFPGNHRFFKAEETRILLQRQALGSAPARMTFRVPSIVAPDSRWGQMGMAGYSSVGYLVPGAEATEGDLVVDCVTADSVVPESAEIGFVKLDLQGGELAALQGMQRILPSVRFMWVEFTLQNGLVDFLADHGFILFDTEYFLFDEPTPEGLRHFEPSRTKVPLSTGRTAWFGFRRRPWLDFAEAFRRGRREFGLVQTDLACINVRYVDEFIAALQHL